MVGNRTLAVLAGLALAASVSVSDAFWGSHGGFGSRGSRGSYGGACARSHGSAGAHGQVGPLRRLAEHLREKRAARLAARGSHGSSGSHGGHASSGSYGSTGGYTATSSSHGGGSTGSYGSAGGYAKTTTSPMTFAKAEKASGQLLVSVPAEDIVFVNDRATTSTGASRSYVSHNLTVGKSYKYRVRVEYDVDGKTVTETKLATLTGGGESSLDFGGSPAEAVIAAKPAETKLTLSVPSDAKVTLSGAVTKQTGELREYTTTRLATGKAWDDYVIRVAVGESVQERTITLRGGESQHLVFEFASAATDLVASLN